MANPVVTIELENGKKIVAELYPEIAPETVNNFVSLAAKGFYDGPDGVGTGGPGYCIKGEFLMNGVKNELSHKRGVLSMARANHPNSAGSQFFIMHQDGKFLNNQYAAFGKVIEGIEVVDEIAAVKTDANDKPKEDVRMKKVTVETFGETYPEPNKLPDPFGRY